MFLKHKISVIFCLVCSFIWMPQVYELTIKYFVKQVNMPSRVNFTDIRDPFPDIYMSVPIDNESLDLPFNIPENDRENQDYIDFITDLTIGEIGNNLRPELKHFSMHIRKPNLRTREISHRCPVTYFTDGFEIFFKISCVKLPPYRRSIFRISHKLSIYSLILTEQGSIDSLYVSHRNDITSITNGQEHMLVNVGKHTKHTHPLPDGPGCQNRTQHSYHDCVIAESKSLLQSSFQLFTVVPLFNKTFDNYRYLNLNSSMKKELKFFDCSKRPDPCRYVNYDTTTTMLTNQLNQSSLSFLLDRSMDIQCDIKYSYPWPEYQRDVIEIVSIWLGFSALSVFTLLTETFFLMLGYAKSIAIKKFPQIFPMPAIKQ